MLGVGWLHLVPSEEEALLVFLPIFFPRTRMKRRAAIIVKCSVLFQWHTFQSTNYYNLVLLFNSTSTMSAEMVDVAKVDRKGRRKKQPTWRRFQQR